MRTLRYEQAVKFCLDQGQTIKSEFTFEDLETARNMDGTSIPGEPNLKPKIVFWTNDKWISANRLINSKGQVRNATTYNRVMPFDACDNERYWVSNQTHVHYLCCYNWHARMCLSGLALIMFLLLLSYTIKIHLKL